MARYTEAVCKLCRREGEKLFLKGERCNSSKCAIDRRNYPPGQHGQRQKFRRKMSDFGVQLREKQKARRIYGVLERQFRKYFEEAQKHIGLTGEVLLQLLERRLDNVVYRMRFGDSRAQARQLVSHGHFQVNGRRTNVPSYLVRPGDIISVRPGSRRKTYFKTLSEKLEHTRPAVDWLEIDIDALEGRVLSLPGREDIDTSINEQLIIEYYSR